MPPEIKFPPGLTYDNVPPGYEPLPEPSREPIGGWDWSNPATMKDPQAVAAAKEQSRQGGVLVGLQKAHSVDEHILQALGTIPIYAAASVTGPAAPFVRMGIAGGLAKARGESNLEAGIDVVGAGLGEAGGAGIRKIASKIAGPAIRESARRAQVGQIVKEGGGIFPELAVETDREIFDAAKKWGPVQIERAFEPTLKEIQKRIGNARIKVPSLGERPMSFQSAVEGFKNAAADMKALIRSEIIEAINAADQISISTRTPPRAGEMFRNAVQARAASYTYLGVLGKAMDKAGRVDPERVAAIVNRDYQKLSRYAGPYWPLLENALLNGRKAPVEIAKRPETTRILGHSLGRLIPEGASRGAERALPKMSGPGMQAGIDAITGQPPLSTLAIQATGRTLGPVIRHTPGTEGFRETLREIEEGSDE